MIPRWPRSPCFCCTRNIPADVVAGFVRNAQRGLRRHWLIAALLRLAAALRGVVLFAYRPALIFPDSLRYLQFAQRFASGHWSPDTIRPSGYSILLIPAAALHALFLIPLAQHALGLAEGVMIYAVLAHRGSRRWLAALAAVPVLFDPLQLDLEQYVLSDVCRHVFRAHRAGRAGLAREPGGAGGAGRRRAPAGCRGVDPGGRRGADRPGSALPDGHHAAVAAAGGGQRRPGQLFPAGRRGLRGLVRGRPWAVGPDRLQRDVPVRPGGPVRRLFRAAAAGLRTATVPRAAPRAAQLRLLHVVGTIPPVAVPSAVHDDQAGGGLRLQPDDPGPPAAQLPGRGGRRHRLRIRPGPG